MKRLTPCLLLFLMLVSALLSCQQEPAIPLVANDDESLSIVEAQRIYDSYIRQNAGAKASDNKDKFEKKLKWDFAHKEKLTDGTQVILVPLDHTVPEYSHMLLVDNTYKGEQRSLGEVFTARKAVIYKYKGKDVVEYMTVVGEANYKKQRSFFDDPNILTGVMLFSDQAGNFLRGWYYKDGKQSGVVQMNDKGGRRYCYIAENYTIRMQVVQSGGSTFGPFMNGTDYTGMTVVCDTWSPIAPYQYTYNSGNTGGGGGGTSTGTWALSPYAATVFQQSYVVWSPDNKIVDVQKYLKCFTNDPTLPC